MRPHAPQLVLLVCVFTQAPPQAIWPVGQAQAPMVQVAPVAQLRPHAPQLVLLVCVFTQLPPQFVRPVAQVVPQVPALQT